MSGLEAETSVGPEEEPLGAPEPAASPSASGSAESGSAGSLGSAGMLARAGLIVSGAYLASRVLGWIRTVVFSAVFGVGTQLDTYYAAFRIPDLVFQLVAAGALGAAVIPVLAGLFAHDQDARAWRVVSTISNLMLGGLLVLAVAAFVAAPWLVALLTPSYGPDELARIVPMTRLMLLSPIFLTLGAIASSALNALGRFTVAAVAPLLYNVAIIAAALFLSPLLGVGALAVGVVVGAFLNAAIQVPSLVRQRGFHFELGTIDLSDPAAREALVLLIPRAIGLGATQITFLVNTTLAAGLGIGALTAYNLAFTAMQIPLGVIGLPLGIILLPTLSRAAALGAGRDFSAMIVRSLRMLLYVMLFLTAVGVVLQREATTFLYDYGQFRDADVPVVAGMLAVFLVGLAGHALIVVLARAYYARKDTRTPVMAAILSVVVNVAVAVATVGPLGLDALAVGIAAGAWFEAILLLILLARWLPGLDLVEMSRAGLLFGTAALGAAAVAQLVRNGILQAVGAEPGRFLLLSEAAVSFLAAALAFVAISRLLRLPELQASLDLARSALHLGRSGA
ncbi:MAG TPA: murein biosynthesis integral membrane protein MurJ [Candidatus Limnocylindrales bacterium]|nr:murein biosynthesis integral membrane protein MurJ [Candidatus Limnocylindrales bacterium]